MVELLPLPERPRFARRMLALWRLHTLTTGQGVQVWVAPGEWPAGVPRLVYEVPVVDRDQLDPGAVMVAGRVGEMWRAVCHLALAQWRHTPAAELEPATVYWQWPAAGGAARCWIPDLVTGQVVVWEVPERDTPHRGGGNAPADV